MGQRWLLAVAVLLASLAAVSPAFALPSLALGADPSASDHGWGGGTSERLRGSAPQAQTPPK